MTLTTKLVLSAAALAFSTGLASAQCAYGTKMRTASTVEEAKPVDVATLVTPETQADTDAAKKKLLLPQQDATVVTE